MTQSVISLFRGEHRRTISFHPIMHGRYKDCSEASLVCRYRKQTGHVGRCKRNRVSAKTANGTTPASVLSIWIYRGGCGGVADRGTGYAATSAGIGVSRAGGCGHRAFRQRFEYGAVEIYCLLSARGKTGIDRDAAGMIGRKRKSPLLATSARSGAPGYYSIPCGRGMLVLLWLLR
jgi:hypothetical protein